MTEQRAQIVGLGLIGTSIAAALRKQGWHVTGSDRNEARADLALELELIDAIGDDFEAELCFIATPVAQIAPIAHEILSLPARRDDLVVTDVGGVKGVVLASYDHPRFVGGHPMAGSEQEGPDGADADLFAGVTWVLTPTEITDPSVFTKVRTIVSSLGAETVALPPESHDALVAVVSHVPHLVAGNLMVLAAEESENHAALLQLAAGGFRDMTRIAAGEPAIWPDIFRDNADAVVAVLDNLIERLNVARDIVVRKDRDQLMTLLERARVGRRNLPARIARPEEVVELRVPVPDRPGVLAEITTVLGELAVNIFDLEIAHSAEGTRGVLVVTIGRADQDTAKDGLAQRGYHPAISASGAH